MTFAIQPRTACLARRLETAIAKYIAGWNEHSEPFRWTMRAREIRRRIRYVEDTSVTER